MSLHTPFFCTPPTCHFEPDSAVRSKKREWFFLFKSIIFFIVFYPTLSTAHISFDDKNRFIMSGNRMSVNIVNDGVDAALAEVSVSWGDSKNVDYVPLVVSNPLLKIPAGGRASVNILYQGEGLPKDRESYMLLNILDVPTAPHEPNNLQIALRHRLKLLYRPPLKETLDDAMANLGWKLLGNGDQIAANNPSPYYLTLTDIEITDQNHRICGEPIEHLMISPFSSTSLEIPNCSPASLRFGIVSDAGNMRPYQAELIPDKNNLGSKM